MKKIILLSVLVFLISLVGVVGASTPFYNASANGETYTGFNFPQNAYTSNNVYANTIALGNTHDYYNYNINVSGATSIDGIEVITEGYNGITGLFNFSVEMSWDGGSSWTTSGYRGTHNQVDSQQTLGGSSDTWGRSWAVTDFNNTNFRIKINKSEGNGAFYSYLDWVAVKVHYTVSGGGNDTCTYSSGNWAIDCSDNCVINNTVDVSGNNISIIGTGTFTTIANITGWNDLLIQGTDTSNICDVTCSGGCFLE